MARYNYFGRGDEYSEWHRNIQDDSLGYIDLDVVEFHKTCGCILFVAETCRFKGSYYKNTTLTRKIAQGLKCRGYLIFYIPIAKPQSHADEHLWYDPYMSFKIARIDHLSSNSGYEFKDFTAEEWIKHLQDIRIRHNCGHK